MQLPEGAVRLLRWTERYTKTDMVYLAESAWWNHLSVGFTSLCAFAASVAFANLVPKEEYGVYQYLLSLSTIIGALTMTGMNAAVTQAVARGFDGAFPQAVRLQLRFSLLPCAIGTLMAGYYLFQENLTIAFGLFLVALVMPVTNALNTYSAYLNGKKDFKGIFAGSVLTNGTYYGAIIVASAIAPSAAVLITVNVLVNAVTIGWLYFQTLRSHPPQGPDDQSSRSYGTHLSAMNVFDTFVAHVDNILVFHFLGAAPLATYNFACAIPERIGGLFKFLVVAGLPKFASKTRSEVARSIVGKTARAMGVGLFVAMLYILVSPFLFSLFFPKYTDALWYSQLYALMIATTAGSLPVTALTALKLQGRLYVFRLVAPTVTLLLQTGLLVVYGIAGIMIARIVGTSFSIVFATMLLSLPERTHHE